MEYQKMLSNEHMAQNVLVLLPLFTMLFTTKIWN